MTENYTELNAPTDTTRSRLALEACRAEIEAVPDSEVVHINIEIPSATATILGALPKIRALEDGLAQLPFYDPRTLERAEARALAMFEAHSNYLDASRPP